LYSKLDSLVYRLYDLTPDEIKIVEGVWTVIFMIHVIAARILLRTKSSQS
jgi:hypothetical protein